MNEPPTRLTVALAQIDPTVGDIDGNSRLIAAAIARARDAARNSSSSPSSPCPATRPRTSISSTTSPRRTSRRSSGSRATRGHHGAGRVRRARRGRARGPAAGRARPAAGPQLAGRAARRRDRGRLPQEPAAQLRRLRRGPLLRARARAGADRGRWRAHRAHDLRGPLGARPAGLGRGRGRRAAHRQPVGLPVPARQGHRARGDVRRPRPRLRRADRLLQPGRAARTNSSSTAAASSSTPPAADRRPRRGQFTDDLLARGSSVAARRAISRSRSATSTRSTRRSVLGVRDYTRKNGFERALVGLSGGIDSALVALDRGRRARRRAPARAWSCRRPTRATRRRPTRARSPPTSAPS